MVFIVFLQPTKWMTRKNPFFTAENAFSALITSRTFFLFSSAKKWEKLYLFMGPANKNTFTHTNK